MLFIAGFGPIVRDHVASRPHHCEDLGESCFGTQEWPSGVSAPQAWLEFEVDRLEPRG